MSGHTPGKWFTTQQGYSTIYVEANIGGGMLQEVAACGPTEAWEQQEANARLIAAAPMLLEALEQIGHSIKQARIVGNDWKRELALIENTVDAALAAATGETK